MEVWKIIVLSKWVIFRFHVNLPGCIFRPIMTHNIVSSVKIFLGSVSSYRTKTFSDCKFPSRESLNDHLWRSSTKIMNRRQLITLKSLDCSICWEILYIGPENRSSITQDITGISNPLKKNIGVYFRLLRAFYSQFLTHITVVEVEKHEITLKQIGYFPGR